MHVVIVDVLRHPIRKVLAPAHRGGLIVWCTAEADLRPLHLAKSKVFGLNSGGELDIRGVLGGDCQRRPSGRRLLGSAVLLRYGAALGGFFDHRCAGTVEVNRCAP